MLSQSEIEALFDACKKGDLNVNTLTPKVIETIRDFGEKSLLDIAILSQHATLANTLIVRAGTALSDDTLNQALRSAVIAGDATQVEALYRLVDAVYHDRYDDDAYKQHQSFIGKNAFHDASERGLEDVVRVFLKLNKSLDLEFALDDAWTHGHLGVVDMLIEVGADGHKDPKGWFVTYVMAISQELLENTSIDEDTRTKLINHLAVRQAGMPQSVAEIDDPEDETFNFYYILGEQGTEPLARYFIQGREQHTAEDIGKALRGAASYGNVTTYEYFLSLAESHGFEVDAQEHFDTALYRGCCGIAERLFDAYEIDLSYHRDQRLVYAAGCDSITLLSTLLRCPGQDVNCIVKLTRPRVSETCTALSRASDPATIRFLLDAKADVNPEGCDTVLRGACEKLRPDAVKMLLDAGAEVNRTGSYEFASTALYYAMYAGCTKDRFSDKLEVVDILIAAGADTRDCGGGKSVLHLHRHLGTYPCREIKAAYEAMLDRDPGLVHCRDATGATPLLKLLRLKEDPALVKVLLDAKADVNAVDYENTTALLHLFTASDSISCRESIMQILQLPVAAGVDLARCVEGKETPLMRLMVPHQDDYPAREVCVETGPQAEPKILNAVLDAILGRPVAGGSDDMDN
jgi:ankyrin repeat protein